MLRKILLALVVIVLVAGGGVFTLVATNSDIIIDKFNAYVENSTGAPLVTEKTPELTLFPNRGLELGASSWQSPDGTLRFSFSRENTPEEALAAAEALQAAVTEIRLWMGRNRKRR